MKFSLLCLILSLSLIKSSEIDDPLIQAKNEYIKALKDSIEALKAAKAELDAELFKVKIINKVGNIASIAGTALLLTPFFAGGLAAVGLGTATTIGASYYEEYFIKTGLAKIIEDFQEREKDAAEKYSQRAVEILNTSSKMALNIKTNTELTRMNDLRSGYKVSYSGVHGISNTVKAGANMSKFASLITRLGGFLSAADIVMTWTMSTDTSELIGDLIEYKEELVKLEMQELEALRRTQYFT